MISTKFIRQIISSTSKKYYHRRVLPDKTYQNDEFFVFPREREGNDYWVNWSMTEDGITPVGESAFRNARLTLLKSRLGISKDATELNVKTPSLTGQYKLFEAGDSLPHQDFGDFKEAQRKGHLESGIDLFVEDGGLGAFADIRIGVRIIASNPALALMGRNLFIQTPPRQIDHKARFNGWNLDPRWQSKVPRWTGDKYEIEELGARPLKGERPIVAFVGSIGDMLAVQLVEQNAKVVGANILVGDDVPLRGLVDAFGLAADALINEDESAAGFSVASTVLNKNGSTTVVISASDDLVSAAAQKGLLYGAYNNYITNFGVSALWNGYITQKSASIKSGTSAVTVKDDVVLASLPDNLINEPSEFIFVDKSAKKGPISEQDALLKLESIIGNSKSEIIKEILKGKKLTYVNSTAEVLQQVDK